jgi:mRNA-degrading endonuclease RelE of RelBE toxin-antitoxin system
MGGFLAAARRSGFDRIDPMAYKILVHERASEELDSLRVYDQRRIVDAIEEQLSHQPGLSTRRRKCLESFAPSFEHVAPVWELRVGAFRVFYDVDAGSQLVHVRAIRSKEPGQNTEDIG